MNNTIKNIHTMENFSEYLHRELVVTTMIRIAERCTHFKIGKTGQSLEDRFSAKEYQDNYDHIEELDSSDDEKEISDIEGKCIDRAMKLFPNKCDNKKGGEDSLEDQMKDDASTYRVYIVYK